MKIVKAILCTIVMAAVLSASVHASDMFIVRNTDKSVEEVVTAVERYANDNEWLYFGANKVRKGSVTLVKTCIPEIGKLIWPQGLKYSAMLPCGNMGIYTNNGKTEISVLNGEYMNALAPSDDMAVASERINELLNEMLEAVIK